MNTRHLGLAAILGLSACVAGADTGPMPGGSSPAAPAYVEILRGGSFSGSTGLRVHSDDRIETLTGRPGGSKPTSRIEPGRPGVYEQVMAVVMADAPAAARSVKRATGICMDYGQDSLRVEPPMADIPAIVATCPDDALIGLHERIRAIVAGG